MSMPLALATLSPCCETPDIHPRHNYTLGFKEETVDVSESKPGRGELRVMVVLLLDERGLVSGTVSLLVREDVLQCTRWLDELVSGRFWKPLSATQRSTERCQN